MAQVDEFLDILTRDYSSLFNENAVLKSKMKVLVDKVEEYRSTEDAMRKAFMIAQRQAEDLIKDAESRKSDILRRAEADAKARMEELARGVEAEEFRLAQAKKTTAAYVSQIKALLDKGEQYLDQLDQLAPAPPPPADRVEQAATEIDDNVQRLLDQAMKDAAAENLRAKMQEQPPEEPEDLEDTAEFDPVDGREPEYEDYEEEDAEDEDGPRQIDFGSLQFGRDYEIK